MSAPSLLATSPSRSSVSAGLRSSMVRPDRAATHLPPMKFMPSGLLLLGRERLGRDHPVAEGVGGLDPHDVAVVRIPAVGVLHRRARAGENRRTVAEVVAEPGERR